MSVGASRAGGGTGRRPGRPGSSSSGRKGSGRSPVSRTSELAKKRERRSSRLRAVAFFGLVAVLVLAAIYLFWFRDSSFVAIENLEVTGVNPKTEEGKQIDQAVRTAMGEMTTLHLRPDLLAEELARFPRVFDTKINASFPDSASVSVRIREDGSLFGSGSQALLIATDGTVLGSAAGQEGELPLIGNDALSTDSGDSPISDLSTGTELTGPALSQALVLGAAPARLRPYLIESEMVAGGVELALTNDLTLFFGQPTNLDQKWRAAASVIADPSFELNSYVDLSFPRRPAIESAISSEQPLEEVVETP